MIKFLSILGLFLFVVSCSTTGIQPQNQLDVIERWSGYAVGKGAECSNAKVEIEILEDFSIKGSAYATSYSLIIPLKGRVDLNNHFLATGSASGGIFVTFRGIVNGRTASGTWETNMSDCQGTWEMAKNNP